MKKTLKTSLGVVVAGLAILSPGVASAGATTPAPKAPKPVCQASETHLCPPPQNVKADTPRGYTIPKKPRGYSIPKIPRGY